MTKTFFAIALIVTHSMFVNARTSASAGARQTPAAIEQTVLQLEKDWIAAQLRADTVKLDELAAETLVYTHSSGGTDDKAAYLGKLKSGAVKYLAVDREDIKANVYGDSAVVTCKVTIKVRVNGEDRTVRARQLHVYAKVARRWRLVAHQTTNVS